MKFLLATTDPQKLPVTILSRCLQFNLKRLAPNLINDHLVDVLGRESIGFEAPAIRELARAADGSMRDALSLLDQAIAFGAGDIKEDEVRAMLGTIERGQVVELIRALIKQDAAAILGCINQAAEQSPDFAAMLAELLSMLQRIAVAQAVPDAIDDSEGDRDIVLELARHLSREDVQLYYQIGLIGRRDLSLAPDPRGGFEMVLLRMLAFQPEQAGAQPAPPAAAPRSRSAPAAAEPPTASTASTTTSASAAPPSPAAAPAPPAATPAPASDNDWPGMIDAMRLKGMVRQLAVNCSLVSQSEDRMVLNLDPAHSQLLSPGLQDKLQQALSQYRKGDVNLTIEAGQAAAATPAQQQAQAEQARQAAAEQAIANDETLHAFEEVFDARVQEGSVRPLD